MANRLAGDARLIGDCAHHVLRADAVGMTDRQQQSRHPWLHGVIAIRAARTIIAEASIFTEAAVVPWARAGVGAVTGSHTPVANRCFRPWAVGRSTLSASDR